MAAQESGVWCEIRSYLGNEDGFRFGELTLRPGGPRHFLFDRLNRKVRIWRSVKDGLDKPDTDQRCLSAAMCALTMLEPLP